MSTLGPRSSDSDSFDGGLSNNEKMHNGPDVLMSLQEIHNNLVKNLFLMVKKGKTVNPKKCLIAKYQWVELMQFLPAEFLVFKG
ncbi:hypothetical protein VP01_4394g2 [Puccinia sorghi]|uniref:Uncharacterized protein n=1 Tax=Puccinia sorghi TaxID=27349 RepID=A0A0L6UPP5_9BASI|nr:hypothetical protein VP01_4394g2 [Puccinia sorghi]